MTRDDSHDLRPSPIVTFVGLVVMAAGFGPARRFSRARAALLRD